MGRPRKPYFRESDGWWVSRFQGEYVKLAKGRENDATAKMRFHELMALPEPKPQAVQPSAAGGHDRLDPMNGDALS